ncbi:hypothetical protein L1787_01340 [Acuticoccus sp. M5D2P5]|uniref:hypothetical protein n=1 Tax=Acuticoccus kalidii TaxID=2910977 RepID=UPI001F45B77D|nr:hypothetical protein [Acuticoccus kalidii]MCF3932057.1 hypothetical protein [Acuticoccus kalidii]
MRLLKKQPDIFDDRVKILAKRADTTIVSTEVVERLSGEEKAVFAERLAAIYGDPRVVIYIRHPVDFAVSSAQQAVKAGSRTYEEVCRNPPLFDYRDQLGAWEAAVGRENMVVRPFDRASFAANDVIVDFLDAIGRRDLEAALTLVRMNEGMSQLAVHVISELTKLCRQHDERRLNIPDLRDLPGPKFRLPPWTVGYVQGKSLGDIEWLAQEWGIAFDTESRFDVDEAPEIQELVGAIFRSETKRRSLRAAGRDAESAD